ncbi:MAG: glycosyltransferase family 39 protein [Methylococcales bacterium]
MKNNRINLKKNQISSKTKINIYLFSIVTFIAFLLILRNMGLYPTVFADEYTYSKFSRLVPFEAANLPNYLYFFIYKVTNLCGDGFLGCARILNVIFFVSAAPFIYLIARKPTGQKTALLIAALSILGPINTYTAYFMPESLYFLSFWIFTYLAVSIKNEHTILRWLFMGVVFGISTLIKPHALFFIPALGIYFFIIQRQFKENNSSGHLYSQFVGFFAMALSTKLIIGFALAGISGITLFGTSYTSIASGSMWGGNHYVSLIMRAFENLQGHLLALSLLFSVPIAHLLLASKWFLRRDIEDRFSINIALYTLLVLVFLLIVVVLFTASIAGSGPYESNARLHMRYYNFAFPLLFLVVASQLSVYSIAFSIKSRAIVGFPIGLAICYAIYTHLAVYTPSFVDSPELRGFTVNSSVFYVLSGLSIFSLALWVYADRLGAKIFMYLYMPLVVIFSTFYVNQELRQRLIPDVFDKAGIFTKQYLSNEDISKVLILGSNLSGMFRTLYYLDNPKASLEDIPEGAAYDLSKLPAGKEWILVVGDHSLPDNNFYHLSINDFTLVHVSSSSIIDFKKSAWPGVISRTHGLSSSESWGTWSSSDVVTFEFNEPLPEKFNVLLTAYAFGPNVGKEFLAVVGDRVVKFTLGAPDEKKILEFDNPKRLKLLKIIVPSPISPKDIGMNDDKRTLGIGFIELRIERLL